MPANGKVHDLKALRTLIKSWIFPLLVWKQDVKWLAERVNASFWSSDEGTLQKVSHLKHNIVDLLPSIADLPARRSLQCGRRRRKSGWYKTFRTSWTSSKCLMHLQFMSFTGHPHLFEVWPIFGWNQIRNNHVWLSDHVQP